MRKFIITLSVLFSFFFLLSFFVRADIHGPNECCELEHDFTSDLDECSMGDIVGPPNPKWCDVDDDGDEDSVDDNPSYWATCCFLDSVYTVSDWLVMVFMASALIIFAVAGYLFLFSGGDPNKVNQAKAFILYGIIAVFLVLLSKVIPAIIKAIVA